MMTQDRTRKQEIRARMAASGEPYSVAARNIAASGSSSDGPLTCEAAEIAACAVRTLAEPSARMAYRIDRTFPRLADMGLPVRLIGTAVKTYWKWAGPDVDFAHSVCEGFAEPATGRYMLDGAMAELRIAGTTFHGRPGRSLDKVPFSSRSESGDALWYLRLLPGITQAGPEGAETLRGTLCRKFTARVDVARAVAASPVKLHVPLGVTEGRMLQPSLRLTVWVDDQHIRQVWFRDGSAEDSGSVPPELRVFIDNTLELWDFGVLVSDLDWSRLPGVEPPPDTSRRLLWPRKTHRD
ncbi:MAG TPA: hypothetical protein VGI74_02855 [Streptosporangiaceae bacterium]